MPLIKPVSFVPFRGLLTSKKPAQHKSPSQNKLKEDPQPTQRVRWLYAALAIAGLFLAETGNTHFYNYLESYLEPHRTLERTILGKAKNPKAQHRPKRPDDEPSIKETQVTVPFLSLLALFSLSSFYLCVKASKKMGYVGIKPKELWAELHKQGLTGKGIKITMLDSGFFEKRKFIRKPSPRFFTVDDLDNPVKPESVRSENSLHGAAVADMLKQSCPDAELTVISQTSKPKAEEFERNKAAYLKQITENPEHFSIQGVVKLLQTDIDTTALAIRKSIDQGSHVINISMGTDIDFLENIIDFLKSGVEEEIQDLEENLTPEEKYWLKLKQLKSVSFELERLRRYPANTMLDPATIKPIFQPWLDALDYASQHNVPVIQSSGNLGGYENYQEKEIGQADFYSLWPHPALFMIGSTNENGEISDFTSEYNHHVQPFAAANGTKELLKPYGMDEGTSFSAPDFTALYAHMKSVKPDLTLAETRAIIQQLTRPAGFVSKMVDEIREEVTQRLKRQGNVEPTETDVAMEMIAEAKRRVGHGTIAGRRLAIVEETKRQWETALAQKASEQTT